MKKNEFATFLAYIAMFVAAVAIGIGAIKPVLENYGADLLISPIALIIIALIIGVLFNAFGLELMHLAGAKSGKYRVRSWTVFGIKFTKKDGKRKVGFGGYEGLTGQTKVVPLDREQSSLSAFISLPIIFLFVEVIALIIIINVCTGLEKTDPKMAWLHVSALTVLATAAIIFIYDLFPAHIDAANDGYLLMLLTKRANRVAYNDLLLQETALEEGTKAPNIPVYDDITDFTAYLNFLAVYNLLAQGKMKEAVVILDKIYGEESRASGSVQREAIALKLATLLEKPDKMDGRKFYSELDDDEKRYISLIETMSALRAYLLIASFCEPSDLEANYALEKVEKVLSGSDPVYVETEKSLVQLDLDLTRKEHPTWDLTLLPWEEAARKKAEEEKQKEEEAKEESSEEEQK